jgi:glutathione gamma-glutamylcysteinyltransferase
MTKYCVEDLPNLLEIESLDNVPTLLSHLIATLPSNAGALIKWVVEVRRKEEDGSSLCKEENERLLLKVILHFISDVRSSLCPIFWLTLHSPAGKCVTPSP